MIAVLWSAHDVLMLTATSSVRQWGSRKIKWGKVCHLMRSELNRSFLDALKYGYDFKARPQDVER